MPPNPLTLIVRCIVPPITTPDLILKIEQRRFERLVEEYMAGEDKDLYT